MNTLFKDYPRKVFYILLGMATAYPLTCLLTNNLAPEMPFFSLMLAASPLAFILPFTLFKHRITIFVFTLLLALSVGFAVFMFTPLLFKIAASLFVFIACTMLGQINAEKPYISSVFCIAMLIFDCVAGFMLNNTVTFNGLEYIFDHSIYISVFSIMLLFFIQNIDRARYFGADKHKLPGDTKRLVLIIIIVLSCLTAGLAFTPIILDAIKTLFNYIKALIAAFFALFKMQNGDGETMESGNGGFFMGEPGSESNGFGIPPWLAGAIVAVLFAAGLSFLLFKLAILIIRLVKHLLKLMRKTIPGESIAYTTVVEKIGPKRRRRSEPKNLTVARQRYSSLRTEAERVRYVYREYVKRARQAGLTDDRPSCTPNDVLGEIDANTDDYLPPPGELGDKYNAARYGAGGLVASGADELKKRLL